MVKQKGLGSQKLPERETVLSLSLSISLYLLLGPQLVKHFLDFQLPVILKGAEGVNRHLEEARLLDSCQLVQNSSEQGPGVRVGAPAVCGKKRRTQTSFFKVASEKAWCRYKRCLPEGIIPGSYSNSSRSNITVKQIFRLIETTS